jgi:lysophospholipid acyltransferase (LPLAT)-like uncharacterized protein
MRKMFHKLLLFLSRYIAYIIFSVISWTFRYKLSGFLKPHPRAVYVFWHRNIIPLLLLHKNEQIVILISKSKDGDFIAEPTKAFGYIPIRGSSSKDGSKALKEMIKLSKKHFLAITPDGPKGPAQHFKEGALQLAYLTKLPMIAGNVKVSKAIIFKSWDRFILPLPFAKISVTYSPPINIVDKSKFDEYKGYFEGFL